MQKVIIYGIESAGLTFGVVFFTKEDAEEEAGRIREKMHEEGVVGHLCEVKEMVFYTPVFNVVKNDCDQTYILPVDKTKLFYKMLARWDDDSDEFAVIEFDNEFEQYEFNLPMSLLKMSVWAREVDK